jgi:hypothetical protein
MAELKKFISVLKSESSYELEKSGAFALATSITFIIMWFYYQLFEIYNLATVVCRNSLSDRACRKG